MTAEHLYHRYDLFKGGPGLQGYAYRADIYCEDCIKEVFTEEGPWNEYEFMDSETVPQPIFFGEHEEPQYCTECGEYLYGGDLDE